MAGGRPKKNDEGTIYFDKRDKCWRCQYKIIDPNTLNVKRKSKSFKTEEDAKDYLTSLKYQKENALYDLNGGIPLNLLIKANIEKKDALGLIGDNQYNRLNRTLRKIEEWESSFKNIDEISGKEIQDYLNSLKDYSNSYITKIEELLQSAYSFAMNKGYIKRNPMADVIRPKSNKANREIRAMTIEEQQVFTNYLMNIPILVEPYKNLFLMQLFLGVRIGEGLALKSTDIDLQRNLVNINRTLTVDKENNLVIGNTTKTYSGIRQVPIPLFIRNNIKEQMKIAEENPEKLLFVTKNKTLVHPNNMNNRLKRILKVMNMTGFSTHSLRHTYGTRCIESGMRAVAVQRLLGHKDVAVTLNTYTTIFNKYKLEEIEKVNQYYLNNDILTENDLLNEGEVLELE